MKYRKTLHIFSQLWVSWYSIFTYDMKTKGIWEIRREDFGDWKKGMWAKGKEVGIWS